MRPRRIGLATLAMAGICVTWGGGPANVYSSEDQPAPAPVVEKKAAPAEKPLPGAGDPMPRGLTDKFNPPYTAVSLFLIAVRAKDPVGLAEATALRAPTEARPENQPLFTAILERTLTEDELAELAHKLEGYEIVEHREPGNGNRPIVLKKPGSPKAGDSWVIKTRHEKSGWKVVDINASGALGRPILIPRARMGQDVFVPRKVRGVPVPKKPRGVPVPDRVIPPGTHFAIHQSPSKARSALILTGNAPAPDARLADAGDPRVEDPKGDRHFRSPTEVVVAFLDALRAGDPVRLAQTIAVEAPTKAKPENRPLFAAILEHRLPKDDLAKLAATFGGFQILGLGVPKATGFHTVILAKPGPHGWNLIRRIRTVWHKQEGWKVFDLGDGEVRQKPVRPTPRRDESALAMSVATAGKPTL